MSHLPTSKFLMVLSLSIFNKELLALLVVLLVRDFLFEVFFNDLIRLAHLWVLRTVVPFCLEIYNN